MRWARANLIEVTAQERKAFAASSEGFSDALRLDDDVGQNARTILEGLRREAERAAAAAEGRIRQSINRAGQAHTRQWAAAVSVGTQIDVTALLRDDDLTDFLSIRSEQFNSLIRNLSEDIRHRIERETLGSIFEGRSNVDVRKALTDIEGIGKNRAKLIARDQASKLNGAMNEFRQRQAGVTHYRWKSMMDPPRARHNHMQRNGKVFAWDVPPSDGHPGRAINCRCRALAVLVETPEDAETMLPPAPEIRTEAGRELVSRVAGTMSSDVLEWSRDAVLLRHAETLRAKEAVDAMRAAATAAETDDLFSAVFGFGPEGQDLGRMSGLTGVRAMAATRKSMIFAAVKKRLAMIEELLEHAAETAAIGAATREVEGAT